MPNFKKRKNWSRRECPYCESTLIDARGLSTHIKRVHPEKRRGSNA